MVGSSATSYPGWSMAASEQRVPVQGSDERPGAGGAERPTLSRPATERLAGVRRGPGSTWMLGPRIMRDLIAVVAVTVFAYLLSTLFAAFAATQSQTPEGFWQLDEWLVAAVVLGLGATWFAYRRWREASTEIAARRRAEQALADAQRWLQLAVHGSRVGVWDWDLRSLQTHYSPGWKRLLGYGDEELEGSLDEWWGLLHPADRDRIVAGLQEHLQGAVPTYETELRVRRKDGSYRWMLSRAIVLRDTRGHPERMLGTHIDITERKELQEAVRRSEETYRQLAESLERRVAERTRELSASQDEIRALNVDLERRVADRTAQLAAANEELEAFNYSISHDLQAPLRAVHGFARILLEDYASAVDAEGQDYLRRVCAAAERMRELIDDLLQLSRLTREEVRREAVDLSAMARVVAGELERNDPDRRVTLVIADGVTAFADARLVRVVIENLFANAWKYTSKRAAARIEFGIIAQPPRTGSELPSVYFVRDDGAGFDMAYASKLFYPFQRLHRAAEFTGTGIGLATVKRIVHRHGGRIWAEGAIEGGATFYFTLGEAQVRLDRETVVT